jgi:hypothetical protein
MQQGEAVTPNGAMQQPAESMRRAVAFGCVLKDFDIPVLALIGYMLPDDGLQRVLAECGGARFAELLPHLERWSNGGDSPPHDLINAAAAEANAGPAMRWPADRHPRGILGFGREPWDARFGFAVFIRGALMFISRTLYCAAPRCTDDSERQVLETAAIAALNLGTMIGREVGGIYGVGARRPSAVDLVRAIRRYCRQTARVKTPLILSLTFPTEARYDRLRSGSLGWFLPTPPANDARPQGGAS